MSGGVGAAVCVGGFGNGLGALVNFSKWVEGVEPQRQGRQATQILEG